MVFDDNISVGLISFKSILFSNNKLKTPGNVFLDEVCLIY